MAARARIKPRCGFQNHANTPNHHPIQSSYAPALHGKTNSLAWCRSGRSSFDQLLLCANIASRSWINPSLWWLCLCSCVSSYNLSPRINIWTMMLLASFSGNGPCIFSLMSNVSPSHNSRTIAKTVDAAVSMWKYSRNCTMPDHKGAGNV